MFMLFLLQESVALTGIGKKRSHCVIIYQVSEWVCVSSCMCLFRMSHSMLYFIFPGFCNIDFCNA